VFTLNNPKPEEDPRAWPGVRYLVFQKERAGSGTPHFQGYVTFEEPKTKGALKKINKRAHWEKRMGTHQQAMDYCMKKDTRVAGPWTLGEHVDAAEHRAKAGERHKTSLEDVKKAIDDGASMDELWKTHYNWMCRYSKSFKEYSNIVIAREKREQPHNVCFWGPPGTGKTHRVITSIERLGLTAFWYRPGVNGAWFDGYDPLVHNCVVFDEFKGQVPYMLFLALLDKYPCHVEGKGTSIVWRPTHIFITSNFAPNEWYGRNNNKKEFHSTHEDKGSAVVVEKNFDASALMRRLTSPMGKIYEMTEKYIEKEDSRVKDSLDVSLAVIEASDDEAAANILSTIIDLTSDDESPPNSIDDNPYLNYLDGDGRGEYDDDCVDDCDAIDEHDDVDWEQEGDVQDALDESRRERAPFIVETPPTSPRPLNKATVLKRTDELTFRKPEQTRALFKKLGPEPVQSKLAWAPAAKKRQRDDDDDDVDDKINENSQTK